MNDTQLGNMLVDIAHINHKLSDENFLKSLSGDTLSYTGLKLAAMKASILELKVSAHQDMLDKETDLETAKAKAYSKYREEFGVTAAGDMKNGDKDYIKAKKAYNEAKVNYEKLRSVTADSHDLIESIRSRVIDLQGARKDERIR